VSEFIDRIASVHPNWKHAELDEKKGVIEINKNNNIISDISESVLQSLANSIDAVNQSDSSSDGAYKRASFVEQTGFEALPVWKESGYDTEDIVNASESNNSVDNTSSCDDTSSCDSDSVYKHAAFKGPPEECFVAFPDTDHFTCEDSVDADYTVIDGEFFAKPV